MAQLGPIEIEDARYEIGEDIMFSYSPKPREHVVERGIILARRLTITHIESSKDRKDTVVGNWWYDVKVGEDGFKSFCEEWQVSGVTIHSSKMVIEVLANHGWNLDNAAHWFDVDDKQFAILYPKPIPAAEE